MSRVFAEGDKALIRDDRGRSYLVTLKGSGEFHTHHGFVSHDELIGAEEGKVLQSTMGREFLAVRPTLTDFVLKMPRGAQVIYPKDLGTILILADIYGGVRVLEAGVGSGALSIAMVRAGANVVGYEIREDFARHALNNVESFVDGNARERYQVKTRDVYEGIDEDDLDRIVLDLPEPWRVLKHARDSLRVGGILLAYLPSVTQVVQLREALEDNGFGIAETVEILSRSWHIDGRSVRPDHRMVAHTGFLTHARLLRGPL